MLPLHPLSLGVATFMGVWCIFLSTLALVLAVQTVVTKHESVALARPRRLVQPLHKVKSEARERSAPEMTATPAKRAAR